MHSPQALSRTTLALTVLGAVCALPGVASAQGRRGPVVVLGLRAPDGDDEAAVSTTSALRRAARTMGFDTPAESPGLEQLVAAFGCDDSVPLACVEQIAGDLHATRIVYGSVRRVGTGREAPLRIELYEYESTTHQVSTVHEADLARAISQDSDAATPTARHLLESIFPTPGATVAPVTVAPPPVTNPPPVATAPPPVATPRANDTLPPVSSSHMAPPERVFPLEPAPVEPVHTGPSWQRIAGFGALGVGGAFAVVGIVYSVVWAGFSSDQQDPQSAWARYQPFPANDSRTHDTGALCDAAHAGTPNAPGQGTTPTLTDVNTVCDTHGAYQRLEWGFLGAGAVLLATGVVLLVTAPQPTAPVPAVVDREHRRAPVAPAFAFSPIVAPGYQGATFDVRF